MTALKRVEATFASFLDRQYGPGVYRRLSAQLGEDATTCNVLQDIDAFTRLMHAFCWAEGVTLHNGCAEFGKYVLEVLWEAGYAGLVSNLAGTMTEFLTSLNHLHLFLTTAGILQPGCSPEFRASKIQPSTLELHCLLPKARSLCWVMGFCEAVAEVVFGMSLFWELQSQSDESCRWLVFLDNTPFLQAKDDGKVPLAGCPSFTPEASLFDALHPYHFVMDAELKAIQFGSTLRGLLLQQGGSAGPGAFLPDVMQILAPCKAWDPAAFAALDGASPFLLQTEWGLQLKGSFHSTKTADGTKCILFVGSPRLDNLQGLISKRLSLTSLPASDLSSDYLIMSEKHQQASQARAHLEQKHVSLKMRVNEALEEVQSLCRCFSEAPGRELPSDSPAQMMLGILEKIISGHERVHVEEARALHSSILHATNSLLAPANLMESMSALDYGDEVKQSLLMLVSQNDAHGAPQTPPDVLQQAIPSSMSSSSDSQLCASELEQDRSSTKDEPTSPLGEEMGRPSLPPRLSVKASSQCALRASFKRQGLLLSECTLRVMGTPSDPVMRALASASNWQFDAFELDAATGGRPLSAICWHAIQQLDLLPACNALTEVRLSRFLAALEEGYPQDNPYHNRTHAADVVQTMFALWTRGGLKDLFGPRSPAEVKSCMLSCILAAAIHDFDHKGVNNDFLIKSRDSLALLYNDQSPLENHHVASAFLILSDSSFNFLSGLDADEARAVRKTVIDLVLATDMKLHFTLLSAFNMRFKGFSSREHSFESAAKMQLCCSEGLDNDQITLLLQLALKCSDLSHLCTFQSTHVQWVERLEEEFFRQGDRERLEGLQVSPLMDRTRGAGISCSQVGFFNVIALPLMRSFCGAVPQSTPLLDGLMANFEFWDQAQKQP